jgi:hypothetical protein
MSVMNMQKLPSDIIGLSKVMPPLSQRVSWFKNMAC